MSNELLSELYETMADYPTVMLGLNKNGDHNEPMYMSFRADNTESIWFFTTKDNRIAGGGKAMAQYVGPEHKLFASIAGQLEIETNTAIIVELFKPPISSCYKLGLKDESMEVLRLDIHYMEIWEKDLSPVARLKMALGAQIEEGDLGRHAVVEN